MVVVVGKPTFRAYLKVKVTDVNGRCVYFRRYRAHSFVVGFANDFYQYAINSGGTGMSFAIIGDGTLGNTSIGIVVGSGTAAPTINDTALSQLIPNGTGVGELQYGSLSGESVATNTSTNTATRSFVRSFTNSGTSSVTVSEVGFYDTKSTLILHDLLSSAVTLQPGQVLTITYDFVVTT